MVLPVSVFTKICIGANGDSPRARLAEGLPVFLFKHRQLVTVSQLMFPIAITKPGS